MTPADGGTRRKRQQRKWRYGQRVIDDRDGRTLISVLPGVEHGTETGYTEYGCHCEDLGGAVAPLAPNGHPVSPWGCQQAGVAAAQHRRAERRTRVADTLGLRARPPTRPH